MEFSHYSVMLPQCMEGLNIKPDGIYIDGTAGGAGHSRAIAERLTTGQLLSFDRDPDAVAEATKRLAPYPAAEVIHSEFARIPEVLAEKGIEGVDGILLDLGVSSYQLDNPERGFAYSVDAPLDMRMSREGMTAADILNTYDVDAMARIFREFGEERFAYPIAKRIAAQREKEPFTHTGQLVELIYATIPAAARREGGHPAKRVFQALRIAVNHELDALEEGLDTIFEHLAPGGRLCVITFHSLEDRLGNSGNYLPFSGRSDHQADLCFFGKGLYLPAGIPGVCMRQKAESKTHQPKTHRSGCRGAGTEQPQ